MAITENPLGWVDYVLMAFMLLLAAGMGLYHALAKGGQNTTRKFFLADRSVYGIAIAMTLLASFISPVTLLGTPAEIYTYGGQYMMFILTQFLLFPSIAILFVPVFHGLNITTAYEYLHLRYGLPLRILGACIFIFQTCFYMAIVSFTPALAIEAVTAFDFWKTILITCIVCIFYTALGGMKAVIWTDVLMFFIIFTTSILVIVMGTLEAGGLGHVWQINKDAGRLNFFQFPLDPTVRMTFLGVVFGTWMNALPLWAVGQTAVQRFLASKSLKHAQLSVWINLPFIVTLVTITCIEGLVLFAFYNEPVTTVESPTVTGVTYGVPEEDRNTPPELDKPDQILIYFVSEQFGHIPGFQGLFISCLFAGALSTVSSGLNAITAVVIVDVYKPFMKWKSDVSHTTLVENDAHNTLIAKVLTVGFGILTMALAFVASSLGTLVTLANSVFGAFGGPLAAAFLLGMLWERANLWGVLTGTIISFILGIWIVTGSVFDREAFVLYQISFNWYATLTIFTTVAISIPLSEWFRYWLSGEDHKVDPQLLSPYLRPYKHKPVHTSENGVDLLKQKPLNADEYELEKLGSSVS